MDPTTAIIQFIGIVLFSTAVPNDPGLHAILPRIGHVHQRELKTLPRPTDPENLTRIGATGIENHVSVIIYRADDRLNRRQGWRSDGRLNNGWKYVVLDGERVRFTAASAGNTITTAIKAAPSIPSNLPRTGASDVCKRHPQSLREEYQPPYRGAAGVIDIDAGRLSSCETNTKGVTARQDTRLLLDTNGKLVITGTKDSETKTIVLKGDAVVFVANVPPYTLLKDTDLDLGAPHWMVYNSMLSETCAVKPEVDQTVAPLELAFCDPESLGPSYLSARRSPPMDFQMIDSACSNTQWP